MSVVPFTLHVSGGASTAVVGLYLVRCALERIGKGAVEGVRDPSNPCPFLVDRACVKVVCVDKFLVRDGCGQRVHMLLLHFPRTSPEKSDKQ